jgi:6-phosphogluconolactonase (cycloisomerase 2 family)
MRRFSAAIHRGVRVATLTALVFVAAVTALLPAGAGAADGAGARIYWSNESGAIRFADVGGSAGTTLFGGEGGVDAGPCGVALDPAAGKVYWTNFFPGQIRAANLDGSGTASTLFTDAGSVCGVALDRAAGKIYWANYTASSIRVANLDGTGVAATLFTELPGSGPSGVVIDRAAGKIYWTNQHSNELRVANLDGSGTASTLFGPAEAGDNPIGLAIDPAAGKVYWAALGSGEIRAGNIDGSGGLSTLFTGEESPGGVALDATAGKLYWASYLGGGIRAGNLDGSGSPATVVGGERLPLFPALLQAPQSNGAPAISGGASLGDALSCSPGSWKSDLDGAFLFRAPRTFAYQWQLDGSDIPGATTSSFTFTEPGDYTCLVTAANVAGSSSQTSAAFTVTLLDVVKYYDRNTNGQLDPSESTIPGWKVRVGSTAYLTPKSLKVDPGVYQVTEVSPKQTNWRPTAAASVQVSAAAGDRATVRFGNVCVGTGGALGTGFWGNKNGQALFGSDDLVTMVSLNLRNANGSNFDPLSYKAFASWLQGSTSTNMAYELSANLAAMKLNVLHGKVNGSSLISAPGTVSANAAGFATVNDVMNEANAELGLHGLTTSGTPFRAYQTVLRDAMLNANGDKTFVQSGPCSFSFP